MDSKQRAIEKFKSNNPHYMVDYYQANKQKFKQKIECPICNRLYAYSNKNKHNNSKKHQKAIIHPVLISATDANEPV